MTKNITDTPTVAEVLASYPAKSYRKYDDSGRLLDWAGTPVGVGSRVTWYDADGQLATGVVRRIDDWIGALWDGSTDAALTIARSPSHTAICAARAVLVSADQKDPTPGSRASRSSLRSRGKGQALHPAGGERTRDPGLPAPGAAERQTTGVSSSDGTTEEAADREALR